MENSFNNLNDYINWRGDISLNNGINEIDALIFATISYAEFDNILQLNTSMKLKDIVPQLKDIFESDDPYAKFSKEVIEMLKNMANSERFSNISIENYQNIIDENKELQFSAISISFDNNKVIAFRGTDDKMVSWKEDLNMSITCPVPAQELAERYLNNLNFSSVENIYIVGHSKGGNLAVYSAIKASSDISLKIKRVYNFDGPGFDKSIIDSSEYKTIEDRIINYFPYNSCIGVLMNRGAKDIVVDCRSTHINQHDPLNWNLMGSKFVYCEQLSEPSLAFERDMREFLNSLSIQERKDMTEALFECIAQADIEELGDLVGNPAAVIKLISNLYTQDENLKENVNNAFRIILDYVKLSYTDYIKNKSLISKIIDKLNIEQ